MTDQAEQLAYLVGCAATFVFAAHSPVENRKALCVLSISLLANWIVCQWTYAPYSPQAIVEWLTGIPTKGTQVWQLADAVFGVIALGAAGEKWFGWAFWLTALIQEIVHAVHDWQVITSDGLYLSELDAILVAQIVLFVVIGGKGVANRIGAPFSMAGNMRWDS